nr:tripartite tricarboxylate transporter permease [Aeromonas caviae]
MVTAFDGYPLACKGQAGKALAIAAYASFTGGTLSAIMLMVAAPCWPRSPSPSSRRTTSPSWCWASPPWQPLPARGRCSKR